MKNIHLMKAVTMAAAVAVSLRMQTFDAAGSKLREYLPPTAGKLFRRVRRMINDRVAGAIAHRERCVTQFAFRSLSDVKPKISGDCGGNSGSDFNRPHDVEFATRR